MTHTGSQSSDWLFIQSAPVLMLAVRFYFMGITVNGEVSKSLHNPKQQIKQFTLWVQLNPTADLCVAHLITATVTAVAELNLTHLQ